MRRSLRIHALVALAALPPAVAACSAGAEAPPADAPRAVRVAPVVRERLAPPVTGTGTLGPKEEVTLSFKVGGIVGRVLVDEGGIVRAGDTLALLDLAEIDAAVARARSAAEKAERDLERARRLYADSVATLEQAQNAQTGLDVARAELRTAEFNRRFAIIVAPAAGVILRRSVEPGELAAPGVPALVLGSAARGTVVRAGLADRDVVRVRRGDAARVTFDALEGRVLEGRITEIAAAPDPMTGTWRVEVAVPAAGLASGLVGRVEIRPSTRTEVALVPIEAALEADGARATVMALSADGAHAERREVRIAFLAGDRLAVTDGLDGVTQVVTDGAAYLDHADPVRVRP
jgi:RND family efflux transporter MFP subunit